MILAFGFVGMGALRAAELAPTTPARDLKGEWVFKADSDLPNVLIIGDSISIGYTLSVRKIWKNRRMSSVP
jgi:acyl-CoA thioesterase-1